MIFAHGPGARPGLCGAELHRKLHDGDPSRTPEVREIVAQKGKEFKRTACFDKVLKAAFMGYYGFIYDI